MEDFFINENLRKYVFPDAPTSWKASDNFFIDGEFCTVFLEKKRRKSLSIPKSPPKSLPKSPPKSPPKSLPKSPPKSEAKPKTPIKSETEKIKTPFSTPPSTPKQTKEEMDKTPSTVLSSTPPQTPEKQIKCKTPPTSPKKASTVYDDDDNETDDDENKKDSQLNAGKQITFLYEDLQQFTTNKKSFETTIHPEKYSYLNTVENIDDTFLNFASTCMEEYENLAGEYKQGTLKNARMYTKLLLGILGANNYVVLTPSELKEIRENTVQDLEDLKTMLASYDIQENEIITLFSEKIKKGLTIYLLFNKSSQKIEGCVWAEAWEKSKEYDYIKVENDDMEEITNSIFIRGLGVKKSLNDSINLKAMLYIFTISEFQAKQYDYIFWKAGKVGEFCSLKEVAFWKEMFNSHPTFMLREGVQKLPKQDDPCDILTLPNVLGTSSFRGTTRGLKALEYCKKNKIVKEDFAGIWKDFQDKTIEICLKKKDCYSNVYLNIQSYPTAGEMLGYFLILKDIFVEKDTDSLTVLENKLIQN
jgi:hypothetical protein